MAEQWTVSADRTSAIVTGRARVSIWKKLNPIWWFGNDTEQNLSTAPWYMPGAPQWWRWTCWQFRNPLQNFRCFVAGVQDRNYTVSGRAPVMTVQRNDLTPPETGWQWCVIRGAWLIPIGFVSYSGTRVVFYAGWQPSGFFGFKIVPA